MESELRPMGATIPMNEENKHARVWVNMTPDENMVIRILSSYIDDCEWTDNTAGNPTTNELLIALNEAREKRNMLLRAAIRKLTTHADNTLMSNNTVKGG